MKQLLLLLLLFTHSAFHAFSQGWNPVGARSASLANTSVCLDDVWAYHHNPGAAASIKNLSIGAYYESRFLTRELQTQALAAAIPLKVGVITVGAQFFGYEQFRNTRAGAGYSLKFTDFLQVGVQGNIQTLRLGGNYGSTTSGTIEAGLLAKVSEKWSIGFSVMNIGRQQINPLTDRFATVLRAGCSYKPSKKVSIYAEVEKQVMTKISFRGALEYQPTKPFFIRLGAQSAPVEFALGFGYQVAGFSIDLGSKYHQTLGWTPNFGLNYQFKKHEKD
ncbi:type IX secretion system membrane protein PorP/SprF [Fluviicola sp.]|uniref:type IX secretion system membrane protein PorP/SprF n=1 Tax=Fluviicola sp. TaxID=1917219 RepID=UPI0031CF8846